jgi:hypothetical protein
MEAAHTFILRFQGLETTVTSDNLPDTNILLSVLHGHFENGKVADRDNTKFFLLDPLTSVWLILASILMSAFERNHTFNLYLCLQTESLIQDFSCISQNSIVEARVQGTSFRLFIFIIFEGLAIICLSIQFTIYLKSIIYMFHYFLDSISKKDFA